MAWARGSKVGAAAPPENRGAAEPREVLAQLNEDSSLSDTLADARGVLPVTVEQQRRERVVPKPPNKY